MAFGRAPSPSQEGGETLRRATPRKTWSNLFKKEEDRTMAYHAPNRPNGSKVVKLPAEVIDEGIKQWKTSLVGQFVGIPPPYGQVVAVINRPLSKQGSVIVSTRGQLFIFQFENSQTLEWILESGPWNFVNRLLPLQK